MKAVPRFAWSTWSDGKARLLAVGRSKARMHPVDADGPTFVTDVRWLFWRLAGEVAAAEMAVPS